MRWIEARSVPFRGVALPRTPFPSGYQLPGSAVANFANTPIANNVYYAVGLCLRLFRNAVSKGADHMSPAFTQKVHPLCTTGTTPYPSPAARMKLTIAALVLAMGSVAVAQNFTNPVIYSDFADNDISRVGDTYYFSASNMHYSPGAPIRTYSGSRIFISSFA